MDFTELATQTPAIAAILIIVGWTFKALKNRDCMLRELGKAYEASRDECHKVQRDAIEVIRETSRVLGENSEVLREVAKVLHRMNGQPTREQIRPLSPQPQR